MMGFFDGLTYTQFNSLEEFFTHVCSWHYRGYKIFGHYAGKYDSLFLLEHIRKFRPQMPFETIMAGSKIIALKIRDKSAKTFWEFCDSSALFPNLSLAKLTTEFETTHKKLKENIDFKTERVDKQNTKHQEYLKNDCLGLYEVIKTYFQIPMVKEDGFALTIASKAMSMWRRTLKHSIQITPQYIQNFVRRSYVGGRCEIFKMKGTGLNYYDVNSLYPFVMRTNPIPTSYKSASDDISQLGFYDVTIKAPDMYIPILPTKLADGGKLIFPTGEFRGVYFSEELKLALERGYKIIDLHEGHSFNSSTEIFSEYIDYWTKIKETHDGALKQVAKLKLNSLYGKFGQREESTKLKTHDGESICYPYHSPETYERTKLVEIVIHHRSNHMLVHIASAITSYARVLMARHYYTERSYYTDTDSVITSATYPVGTSIGNLKLEHGDIDGIFKQPKAYYLEQCGKVVKDGAKIKGFSRDFIKTLDRASFDRLDFKEEIERPASFKRSIISNKNYLSKISITKQIRSEYSKRRIIRGGDTEPWILNKSGIIINQERK